MSVGAGGPITVGADGVYVDVLMLTVEHVKFLSIKLILERVRFGRRIYIMSFCWYFFLILYVMRTLLQITRLDAHGKTCSLSKFHKIPAY